MVKLNEEVKLVPICLPDAVWLNYDQKEAQRSGWGFLINGDTNKIYPKLVTSKGLLMSTEKCEEKWKSHREYAIAAINDQSLCFENQGPQITRHGSSGGKKYN